MGMKYAMLFVTVAGLVIGDALAQNRGSARYAPPSEYASEGARPSRTRTGPVARLPKETTPAEGDDVREYQPPELPPRSGTVARRIPLRGLPQDFPDPTLLAENDRNPVITTEAEELPSLTTSAPSRRPHVRRRRPKKRKKPQATSETEPAQNPGTTEASIADLLNNDEKRSPDAYGNTSPRDAYPTFNPHLRSEDDETLLDANRNTNTPPARVNTEGSQYFRSETPRNRLPEEDTGPSEVPRNQNQYQDVPETRYTSTAAHANQRNRDTYVPVLSPIRAPTRELSAPREYSETFTKNDNPNVLPHNKNYHSSHNSRAQNQYNPNIDVIAHPAPKPSANIIPEVDAVIHPGRIHSNAGLHKEKQPLFNDEYGPTGAELNDATLSELIPTEDAYNDEEAELPKVTNRLPNSSEVHYESIYPSYAEEDVERVTRTQIATEAPTNSRGRQVTSSQPHRNAVPSYSSGRNIESTKPQEYDNDAETHTRQTSRYQPPLQRGSSRHAPEGSVGSSRSGPAYQAEEIPIDVPRRTRGPSRQQTAADVPLRTRGSSRYQPDTSNTVPKTRPTIPTRSQPDRSRGASNSQRDTVESGSRQSSRRQPVNREIYSDTGYQQPNSENSRAVQSGAIPARQSVHSSGSQPNSDFQEDLGGYNSLRSRPQYAPKVAEDFSLKEEDTDSDQPEESPASNFQTSGYKNEHQTLRQPSEIQDQQQAVPRQPAHRGQRTNGYPQYQAPQNPRRREPEVRDYPEYQEPQNPRPPRRGPETRDYPQYQEPQNPRPLRKDPETRDYPQYQEPQNPRRQIPPQNSRSTSRPRHPEPKPQGKPRGSGFNCPDSFGFFADPAQCDKYYECRNGTAEVSLCSDGLAFNEVSAPKYLRCDSLRDVDCSSRPQLQEPQSSPNCPRRFGLFPHASDCTKFFNCVDGAATEVQCPPGLTYNDERATCDWADLVKSSCKTEDLLGFTCPEPTEFDLQDGVYTRYPHPSSCQLHFTCIKGEDGLRRPRMLSCTDGLVFNPDTGSCARPDDVAGCEEFYGPRSAPKKKPARNQPAPPREPEAEEYEEPTPRPRRRGQNRRARN